MADLRITVGVGTRVAVLGLRFWDVVTRGYVGDGLRVSAFPAGHKRLRVEAVANPSGVWVFHHLPGQAGVERALKGAATNPSVVDDAFWTDPQLGGGKLSYIIQVDDTMGRFLPTELQVEAPLKGILSWPVPVGPGFPAGPGGAVPLFTSPTRKTPTGMATVRADLAIPPAIPTEAPKPAAWVIVRAMLGAATLAWGASDEKGRLSLMFPYPEAPPAVGPPPPPLSNRTWDITLSARFAPPAMGTEVAARATLPAVLQQPAKTLFKKWGPAPADKVPLGVVKLKFGEELVAKGEGLSWVWVG